MFHVWNESVPFGSDCQAERMDYPDVWIFLEDLSQYQTTLPCTGVDGKTGSAMICLFMVLMISLLVLPGFVPTSVLIEQDRVHKNYMHRVTRPIT